MELKNAVAICLISFFSATLVLLIARALDLQAAARLEPQLAKIAEELEAIRKSGGVRASLGGAAEGETVDDALMVYYFHGVRCPTCRAAESNARETLEAEYASQLDSGEVVWKVLDYATDPAAEAIAIDFGVSDPAIVLVRMKDGEIDGWNRLDRVLALAKDKARLSAYLRDEINEMLKTPGRESGATQPTGAPAIPVPDVDPPDIPVPADPPDIPLPG